MEYFQELPQAPLEQIAPGIRRFIFSLNRVMSIYFQIEPGVVIGQHSHPHEQMGMLIQGRMKWRVGNNETVLQAPALYRIPSHEPHQVEVLGDETLIVLDIFSPIRDDFLKKEAPGYFVPKT